MTDETKRKLTARLRRIVGQVAGLERMVAEDRYCVDVLLQISAARAALHKVGKVMLQSHIETCVQGAFESGNEANREAKIAELIRIFDKEL